LRALLPPFEKNNNCRVDVISVGTGQALKLGEAGDVDVVLVHARQMEDRFVAAGFGVNRRDVMYNDFIVIGPAKDPAGVARAKSAVEAFSIIAAKGAVFVSRGDMSGTHVKEKELWRSAGATPDGGWYIEAGQGMGPVITMSTERQAYTLADRATYNAYRVDKTGLKILFQGDKALFNPYGVIAVNPQKFPHVKYDLAMRFIDYLTGPEGRKLIAGFKANGAPVFFIYER
jgi:tungstate transport system substrate-binding protein